VSGTARSGDTMVPVRAVLGVLARRPWLAPAALGAALRLARPRWWRRAPLLPLPDPALWRFRMETAYGGSGDAEPSPEDIRTFVEWSAQMRGWRR